MPSLFDMHIKLHTFSTSMNLLPIVPSIYEEVLIESREGKIGSTVLLIVKKADNRQKLTVCRNLSHFEWGVGT